MRSRIGILVCLIVGGLALVTAGPALAQGGTTTSAGDQQYVDPLTTTQTTPAPSTSPSASSSTTPSSTTSTSSSTASAGSQPAATTAATSSTTAGDPSKSLPFTGLNVGLVVAVGAGLLGAGVLVRGLSRRA